MRWCLFGLFDFLLKPLIQKVLKISIWEGYNEKKKVGLRLLDIKYFVPYQARKVKKQNLDIKADVMLKIKKESDALKWIGGDRETFQCKYHNGPLWKEIDTKGKGVEILCYYTEEIKMQDNNKRANTSVKSKVAKVLSNNIAIMRGSFFSGSVLVCLFSSQPSHQLFFI